MITIFRDIELDEDERLLLLLGPDFDVLDVVTTARAAREFLIALTKIRWSRMGRTEEEIMRFIDEELEKDEIEIERETFLTERTFREEDRTLDIMWKRCTAMKGSRRVYMPGNRPVKEEAMLEVRQSQ